MKYLYRWLTKSNRRPDPETEFQERSAFTLGVVLAAVLMGILLLLVYA